MNYRKSFSWFLDTLRLNKVEEKKKNKANPQFLCLSCEFILHSIWANILYRPLALAATGFHFFYRNFLLLYKRVYNLPHYIWTLANDEHGKRANEREGMRISKWVRMWSPPSNKFEIWLPIPKSRLSFLDTHSTMYVCIVFFFLWRRLAFLHTLTWILNPELSEL